MVTLPTAQHGDFVVTEGPVNQTEKKTNQSNETIRYLAFILRHRPHEAKIKLNDGGWAEISKLVEALAKFKKIKTSAEELIALVQAKSKNSFSISDDSVMIKAKSGHTILLGFSEATKVPDKLYIHVPKTQLTTIFASGLTMKPGEVLKEIVGTAPGGSVLATVNVSKAIKEGTKFYSKEEAYFAFHIPSKCFTFSSF
jgi:putative RNA 2'-phosphotransferase